MADWADEKAARLAESTDYFQRRYEIAQALRDTQRKTAEECAVITIQCPNHYTGANVIRERFSLENKQ